MYIYIRKFLVIRGIPLLYKGIYYYTVKSLLLYKEMHYCELLCRAGCGGRRLVAVVDLPVHVLRRPEEDVPPPLFYLLHLVICHLFVYMYLWPGSRGGRFDLLPSGRLATIYLSIYLSIYLFIYIYIYIHTYVHVYIYIYIYFFYAEEDVPRAIWPQMLRHTTTWVKRNELYDNIIIEPINLISYH